MRRRVVASCCLIIAYSASAQVTPSPDAPVPPAELQATYLPADFARYAPRNAVDMLNRVPGFVLRVPDDNEDSRGLGQAAVNVVVNGERLSSKSETITAQLTRISASRVIRIDLVDGAKLGIPGLSGQVANLIVGAGATTGRFEYRATARPKYAKPSYGAGSVSINGSRPDLEWTLGLTHDASRGGAGGPGYTTDGAGTVTEERDYLLRNVGEFPRLTATAGWKVGDDTNVKASSTYRNNHSQFTLREKRFAVSGEDMLRDFTNRNRGYQYELGTEIETGVGSGRLKLIGLSSGVHSNQRSTALLLDAGTREGDGSRYTARADTFEHIVRAEYRWRMLDGDWQLDGEAAFNKLDQTARLFEIDADGNAVELSFPEGTGGVSERRYESILSYGRSLTQRLKLQTGAGFEYSRLAQEGSGGLTRSFWRPKGSLNLAWTTGGVLDASLNIARRVDQLTFSDFLGRVFLDQENQNAGNAELVPEQSWDVELELTGKVGQLASTTLRGYSRWIEDYVDVIPLAGGLESPGNIDSARLQGMEWRTTFTLDAIGWRGARIDTTVELEKSRLRDPLTQTRRTFTNHVDRRLILGLRHDVPGGQWAWGGGAEYSHRRPFYRLEEVGRDYEGPTYTYAFIEHKDVMGLTVNFQVFNLTDGRAIFERVVHDGPRNTSPVVFTEKRDLSVQPIFRLQLKGSF